MHESISDLYDILRGLKALCAMLQQDSCMLVKFPSCISISVRLCTRMDFIQHVWSKAQDPFKFITFCIFFIDTKRSNAKDFNFGPFLPCSVWPQSCKQFQCMGIRCQALPSRVQIRLERVNYAFLLKIQNRTNRETGKKNILLYTFWMIWMVMKRGVKYSSQERNYLFYECSSLLGFIMSKKLRGL